MQQNITIAEVLRGVTPGRIQSVGYMQIIPLISDLVDDSIAPPDNLLTSTSNYGVLHVKNPGATKTILPFAAGFITDQKAQNHAVTKAKIVAAKHTDVINTAACIQSSQGGTIREGAHKMTILPWSIREAAMVVKDQTSYNKLWPTISEFNQNLGLQNRAHLEDYLSKFSEQLDTFTAEFEVVPKQVGAIILLNGIVMGVEKAPNYVYWKAIWTPLIRECYGSLAIQYRKQFGNNPKAPKTRVPLKSVGLKTIKDIKTALETASKQEGKNVKTIINRFLKTKFNNKTEETAGNLRVQSLENNQFIGQVVRDTERVIYGSLVTTGAWIRNKDWHEADDFKM